MDLAGRKVLVTGGARGIGLATSNAFARKDCSIAMADVDTDALKESVRHLEGLGGQVIGITADVTKEQEVERMIDETIDRLGSVDVIVNNAGVSVTGPAEDTPIEDWQWAMDVNVWPHVYAVRKLIPYFRQRGSGHFVHVSSAAGVLGTPAAPAYSLTKFAVFGLAESIATSLHGTGVGVTVVCPQFVDTDIALRGRTNLPEGFALGAEEAQKAARAMMANIGIPPEAVAGSIVEAVENNRFLAFPHPEILTYVRKKWADPDRYIGRTAEVLRAAGMIFDAPRSESQNPPE